MSRDLLLGMAGVDGVCLMDRRIAAAAGRLTDEKALASLTQAEIEEATLSAMPAAARAAFLGAKQHRARAQLMDQRTEQAERARLLAIAQRPAVPASNPKDPMIASSLSPSETTVAREIFARMGQPLTDDERSVCLKLGLSEAAYAHERNEGLAKQLPGAGAISDDARVAHAIGLTPGQFAEAKRRAG